MLRNCSTAHVNLVLNTDGERTDRIQVAGMFSDGDRKASDSSGWAADGLQLVDDKNAKVHLVASDGEGHCLCSWDLVAVALEVGHR